MMHFPAALPAARIPPAMAVPALRRGIHVTGWIADRLIRSVQGHTRQVIAAVGPRGGATPAAFAARDGSETAHASYDARADDDSLDVI